MPEVASRSSAAPASAVANPRAVRLFPLPLTPFEEYMLLDDRPAYPSIGCAALRLSGRFDRAVFQAALEATLTRHPLLEALVQPTRHGRFQWIVAEHAKPVVQWNDAVNPAAGAPHTQIDLQHNVGLRIFVRESDDQAEVLIQLHHACCDGLGYMGFINDFLSTYHELLSPDAARPRRSFPEPDRLRSRGKYGMTWLDWLARIPKDLVASLAVIEYFSHRPVVLAPGGEAASPDDDVAVPLFVAHTFSEAETVALRQAARELGGSVNDLLLTAGFFAVNQWNRRQAPESRQGVVRIAIPVSLRGPDAGLMPAANVMSILYLDRRPHRFASARALIKSVRREMAICKKWRLGLTMIHFIRAFRWLPGGLSRMLPEDGSLATAVLSNLGDVTGFLDIPRRDDGRPLAGNMVLEGWSPLPPLRPGTHASFGVYTDAGRMTISVNCDPQRFRAKGAKELLATFLEQLAALREEAKQPSPPKE